MPYADVTRPEVQALSAQIAAGRGSVLHLYRMLLHSPPVAEGWLRYLTAIRHECALPSALREHLFSSLAAARRIIEEWRADYNTARPHTSLDGLTPAAFATRPKQGHTDNGLCL